ncbi:hypothetical protein QBC34DRAFT_153565 [Podospora aff. communis PSN243]|uniref:Uncharacterized protein n=1 Tax=Podospora aff. communis PSN243 TaxID=3040156 RepID=A0AAV9GEQ6_9PEZI|nr:hypothetical protein QBC34DRAFT_153565 [Podospora aff. communis PSN243]
MPDYRYQMSSTASWFIGIGVCKCMHIVWSCVLDISHASVQCGGRSSTGRRQQHPEYPETSSHTMSTCPPACSHSKLPKVLIRQDRRFSALRHSRRGLHPVDARVQGHKQTRRQHTRHQTVRKLPFRLSGNTARRLRAQRDHYDCVLDEFVTLAGGFRASLTPCSTSRLHIGLRAAWWRNNLHRALFPAHDKSRDRRAQGLTGRDMPYGVYGGRHTRPVTQLSNRCGAEAPTEAVTELSGRPTSTFVSMHPGSATTDQANEASPVKSRPLRALAVSF